MSCGACDPHAGNQECRVIDCHGMVTSHFFQDCGTGGSVHGGGNHGGGCTPEMTCGACDPHAGNQECRVIDCNGMVTSHFFQDCGTGGTVHGGGNGGGHGGGCTPEMTCGACDPHAGNQECRVIDCNGMVTSHFFQDCGTGGTVHGGGNGGGHGGGCTPKMTCGACDRDAGNQECRVIDCNGKVTSDFFQNC
jgi:hypothetical protein